MAIAKSIASVRRRKVAAATTGIVALALVATGCSGAPSEAPTTSITFWHYWTDRADVLQALADQYQEETGVEVKLELVPGDAIGQKFQAAAQADKLPDISASWEPAGEVLAAYANDGQLQNLSDLDGADDWFARFESATVEGISYPADNQWDVAPGAYLVPFDTNNMQFLYNKDLFDQAGITEVPTTMDEFVEAGEMLRAADIQPFITGFASWPLESMATMYVNNAIPQETRDAAYAGEGRYDTQEWEDFLGIFQTLAEKGVFADGIVGYDMPAAETLFASGQVGMIFDGSWALGVFNQTNPDFTNYGVFLPPSLGDQELRIPGGVGSTAFVVGSSPNVDEAAAFLKWLTDAPQQKTYAESSFNIPANREVASELELDENIAAFAEGADKLIAPTTSVMQAPVITTMTKGLQLIIAGTDTPSAVAARMQLALETGQPQ
jgi:ABC-type glycerol-3-phosphate transport system substrate-binding protein